MNFFVSDVHGYAELLSGLLAGAGFGTNDRLWILGDAIAKGPASMSVLRFVMEQENVSLLRGNHEQMLLQSFGRDSGDAPRVSDEKVRRWAAGDGAAVIAELLALSEAERSPILRFLEETPLSAQFRIQGKRYFLVHGKPGPDPLEGRYADFGEPSGAPRGVIAAVGHTPTFKYGKKYAGRMIRLADRLLLDCGVGHGYRLGLFCAETGEEFYAGFPDPANARRLF